MISLLPLLALIAAPQTTTPNVVLIVADDLGVDMVAAYAEGTNPPCTPNIDQLASQGMLFRRAWTNPTCSPTRAAMLTGRHGFRTGIGFPITNQESGLPLSELTLPEMLAGYDSAAAGKWHLHGNLGNTHPNDTGFGSYAGSIRGSVNNYFNWPKITNGQQSISTNYAVSETVDDAVAEMGAMQEPWLLYVSFNAIHSPFHVPPSNLCPSSGCAGGGFCQNLGGNPSNTQMAKAMTEAMDSEIGRLLTAVDGADPDAYIFFLGDNGTPNQVSQAPFLSTHAKGTMYEGGINVPLIVKGPSVANAECNALVSVVDLFASFAELAGVPSFAEDSVSMVPYFSDPSLSLRATVYSETFSNGFTFPAPDHQQAIRNDQFKLIRRQQGGVAEQLFDLSQDPFETNNLLPGLTVLQQANYDELEAALTALTTVGPTTYCSAKTALTCGTPAIGSAGIPSASATSGFVIDAQPARSNRSGIFLYSDQGPSNVSFQGGTLCVATPIRRSNAVSSGGATGCDGVFTIDWNAFAHGLAGGNPQSFLLNPGQQVNVQVWGRDALATGSFLSDALEYFVLQ